jgi:hypothetical protein
VTGYADTSVPKLIAHMQHLIADHEAARMMGAAARRYALERFHIERFADDWDATFRFVTQL